VLTVLLQMFAVIALGLGWALRNPLPLDVATVRNAVSGLVYYLLLPALVLEVIWTTTLGPDSARIAASAGAGVLSALGLAWLICRSCGMARAVTGAMMLAASFPNATYLGLPLLERILGAPGRSIAIQYDLFACTPLLLTVGVVVAQRFGRGTTNSSVWGGVLRVPPLWAAALAAGLNATGVSPPPALLELLHMLGAPVIPLMLLVVGMALRDGLGQHRYLPAALAVVVLQLAIMPLVVWGVAAGLGLDGERLLGTVLEAAMPSMALGVVLCDRYGLDSGVYAAALTLTTALSLATLPLWHGWVGGVA